MLLTAERPGGPSLEYAGGQILPHFYAPKSWKLPLDLGFVAEFGFQNSTYEEHSRHVELRPLKGKDQVLPTSFAGSLADHLNCGSANTRTERIRSHSTGGWRLTEESPTVRTAHCQKAECPPSA
jgi:hypothetical protein